MQLKIMCPSCGPQVTRFEDYQSMLVLGGGVALFSFECPRCGAQVALASGIPEPLRPKARDALAATGADDGRHTWPRMLTPWFSMLSAYPPVEGVPEVGQTLGTVLGDGRVRRFHEELAATKSVDEAIERIGGGRRYED